MSPKVPTPAVNSRRTFSLGFLFGLMAFACVSVAMLWPITRKVYQHRRYGQHATHVMETIRSFHSKRPTGVPAGQWKEAVDWTANLIAQDFFSLDSQDEMEGLERLSKALDKKANGKVDLGTLRWIWDRCEATCGGQQSYGMRFRRIKLLTKGPIDDIILSGVWSLDRCPIADLSQTNISDASIPYLSSLTHLKFLDVQRTQITEDGAIKLRLALPKCKVIY